MEWAKFPPTGWLSGGREIQRGSLEEGVSRQGFEVLAMRGGGGEWHCGACPRRGEERCSVSRGAEIRDITFSKLAERTTKKVHSTMYDSMYKNAITGKKKKKKTIEIRLMITPGVRELLA